MSKIKKFEDFAVEESLLDNIKPVPGARGDEFAKKLAKKLCTTAFKDDEKKAKLFIEDFKDMTKNQEEVKAFMKYLPYYMEKWL